MRRILLILALLALPLLVAACDETNDTDTDAAAAQQFMPSPAGYTETGTSAAQDAFASALGAAGLATGNPLAPVLVQRVDALIDCYRDVGAFDAKIHVQNPDISNLQAPIAGVVGVINQDRIVNNFASCANPLNALRESPGPEPCTGTGSFQAEGDTFVYFYAASDTPLCTIYDNHFATFGG